MNFKSLAFFYLLLIFYPGFAQRSAEPKVKYPVTRKVDMSDTFYGTTVQDPYRWLENDTLQATKAWVKAQNQITEDFFSKIPFREKIRERMRSFLNSDRYSTPFHEGKYYYFNKNSGLQKHDVLYRVGLDLKNEEVFLDPNTFSKDGSIILQEMLFSDDGSLAAYQVAQGGSDWSTMVIMNAENKKILDTLTNIKFCSSLGWVGNDGFYYTTFDAPNGATIFEKNQNHKLYYHQIGTPQKEDKVIKTASEMNAKGFTVGNSEDGRFLILYSYKSTEANNLYLMDLKSPDRTFKAAHSNFISKTYFLTNEQNRLLFYTNLNAPNGRVVEVDFSNPGEEHWKDVIPESGHALEVMSAGGKIFAKYMIDVKDRCFQYDLKGKKEREIKLPGDGSVYGFYGKKNDEFTFYIFSSIIFPYNIYQYNIKTGESVLYKKRNLKYNPDDYISKQVFYPSKDGTKIPMYISYKKGLAMNGKNPTLMYGYGGFQSSLSPDFDTKRLVWLENGGIYVQTNIRGGGEYGEKWHLQGVKQNKQNVFDDFIGAAEYLIKEKYTSPDYLAISGGSNGGLLVGAVATQRPDLFKVAMPEIGVLDMLRYHKFTSGDLWNFDYGTADDSKEMFQYLFKYSPLHAVKPNVKYPAMLISTGDHDDRVVPAHSYKFAATVQEHNKGTSPILLRVEENSGHGTGTLDQFINLMSDQFAFMWFTMGVEPKFE